MGILAMKYETEFTAWLFANYAIYNGDALIAYLEDGVTYETFLAETGLIDD
jgi:hypothetical protein